MQAQLCTGRGNQHPNQTAAGHSVKPAYSTYRTGLQEVTMKLPRQLAPVPRQGSLMSSAPASRPTLKTVHLST